MSNDPKEKRQDSIGGRFTDPPANEQGADETQSEDNTLKESNTDKTSKTSKEKRTDKNDRPSTKDKTALTMYLLPEQVNEFDLRFQEINLEYQREYGERLQKNADFYPAVLEAAFTDKTVRDVLEL